MKRVPHRAQQGHAPAAVAAVALRRGDGSVLRVGDGAPALMGILNLTPDSFSDGGIDADADAALRRAEALCAEGAEILDLGAESTRPGATPVSPDDEWARLAPVLRPLAAARLPVVLSVDTRHLATAERALEHGALLLNLPFPQELIAADAARVRAVLGAYDGVVLLHSRGTPQTMTGLADYPTPPGAAASDVLAQVVAELRALAVELIPDAADRVLFDPGLGFAKHAAHSLALLGQVQELRTALGRPVLIGASRKSFLGAVTGRPVDQRVVASAVAAALAAEQGADIVRVHDVAATRDALAVVRALRGGHAG